MRRDPFCDLSDAADSVLNPEAQTACIGLLNNICNRSADCQVSLLGLEANMRTRLFESCRNALWRARNCNRATSTASGFAQCSESTQSLGCIALLATDLSTTCAEQITLQPVGSRRRRLRTAAGSVGAGKICQRPGVVMPARATNRRPSWLN